MWFEGCGGLWGRPREFFNEGYQTCQVDGGMVRKGSVFACALVFSPVRMAGQTACPEGSSARARKGCLGASGDFWEFKFGEFALGS